MNLNKTFFDEKKYKYITLKNDLDVILISNEKTNRSIVALTINIGSLYNKIEGIAHFLEHMLFMGCEKYSDEGENHFFSIINKYGGNSNAFTTNNFTSYYFTVDDEHLSETIEVFHNFFISPLFNSDSINREISAVNSEYEKNMSIENRKIEEILKELSEINHPYKLFDCGNKTTLDVHNIREKLIDFYNSYYSSDLMKLVISSNHSLDELEKMSLLFQSIPKKKINKINTLEFPIVKKHNGNCIKYIEMLTTDNKHKLNVIWQLENDNIHCKQKPLTYISYLLQNESTTSLNYYLMSRGYIYDMEVNYEYMAYDNFCVNNIFMFYIQFIITPYGQKNTDVILLLLDHYINCIKKNGINKNIFNELVKISKLNMLFCNNGNVNDIINYSIQMHLYNDKKNILINRGIYDMYDENVENIINDYLNKMTLNNSIIVSVSNYKNLLKKTKWYNAEYNYYDSIPKLKNIVHDKFYFNFKSNPFVIENMNLIKYNIHHNELSTIDNVLYKCVDIYNNPTTCCGIIYTSDLINKNIINNIACELYILLFNEINRSIYYYGKQIDMYFSVYMSYNKMVINARGYSDNVILFLSKIKNNFFNFDKMEKIFDKIKMEYIEDLQNLNFMGSYSYAKYTLKKTAENSFFSYDEKKNKINKIYFNDIVEIIKNIFDDFQTQFLIFGNININIINKIKNMFNFNNEHIHNNNSNLLTYVNKLTNGQVVNIIKKTQDNKEINSAINITFQICHIKNNFLQEGIFTACLSNLLKLMIAESFFNILRTKKQFGYVVKCSTFKLDCDENPLFCMSFIIQSTKNLNDVEKNIFDFILEYKNTITDMDNKTFESYKKTMINLLEKKHDTLEEEFYFYFKLVFSKSYIFNYVETLIKNIEKITINDILMFYTKYFIDVKTRSYWNIKINGNKK